MGKLESVAGYPAVISAKGIPANLVRNLTPDGTYQIVRVRMPAGTTGVDYEILFEVPNRRARVFSVIRSRRTTRDC
jgi:acyl CoA:acetate/3-ketoacid CoA transferase alpha subunit